MSARGFTLSLALLVGLAAGPAPAQTAYAIGDGGASLLTFNISNPSAVSRVGFFGGAAPFLDAIDFRPATGELFGYLDATDAYYRVNTATGALTQVSASPVGATTNTFRLGMDFNPTIDRLRVVTDSTQNIVYNPVAGTAAAFTPLFYPAGDANQGTVPLVIDNAYTNSRPEAFGGTTVQFTLDYGTNSLARLANNLGTLTTVGTLRLAGTNTVLDFDEFTGFDIATTRAGADTAYALLTVGGARSLYSINLATAEATSLGAFGSGFGGVYSLAVTTVAPVPVPPTLAGVAGGVLALGLRAARRRLA